MSQLLAECRGAALPISTSASLLNFSDVILSIVQDDKNTLWLATENGLSQFDKAKETFRNFDRYDGFLSVQMEEESAYKLSTGELWFGNKSGILAFNPRQIDTYNCDYNTSSVYYNHCIGEKLGHCFSLHNIIKTY